MSDGEGSNHDRHATIYSEKDYYMLVRPTWESSELNDATKVHKMLRTLVDSHLTHSMGLKNLQKREIKFSDMFVSPIPTTRTDSTEHQDKLFVLNTTYENQQIYYGCLRHRVIEFCPIAALAIYLFLRFHIGDEYGSIELYDFNETKILKGNNKLANISYSQQHKSSLRVLELSQLDASKVNLNKLLCNTASSAKPTLNDLTNFDYDVLLQRAGVNSHATESSHRALLGNVPSSVSAEVFPFLKPDDNSNFRQALEYLKLVLVQDMLYIKKKYPNHPLSLHPIFNSDAFVNFAIEKENIVRDTFASNLYFLEQEDADNHHAHSFYGSSSPDLNIIRSEVRMNYQEQKRIIDLHYHYINSLRNSINGLSILASLNSEHGGIIRQNISDIVNTLTLLETNCAVASIESSRNLMAKIDNMATATRSLSAITQDGSVNDEGNDSTNDSSGKSSISSSRQSFINYTNNGVLGDLTSVSTSSIPFQDGQTKAIPRRNALITSPLGSTLTLEGRVPSAPLNRISKDQLKKDRVLRRRLSRQATTLYEMWDDFKSLERELRENDITVTEWLKTHGSSERQFRHTRMKIIKFIEEEASKRGVPVETIKEKLQTKMRNRQRPWTLDEVQRRLTAFKTIQLDE